MAPSNSIAGRIRVARRRAGLLVLAAAGCALACWILWRSWSDRVADRPASAPALVQEPSSDLDPPVAAGMVNARVRVRVFDGSGNEKIIGEQLAERLSLNLTGTDGQPYEAQFDKVGMWAMEIPPGEYMVSREQLSLKAWKWSLSGRNVTDKGKKGYRIVFRLGQAPTLELALR